MTSALRIVRLRVRAPRASVVNEKGTSARTWAAARSARRGGSFDDATKRRGTNGGNHPRPVRAPQ